jgi:hypothetical protein
MGGNNANLLESIRTTKKNLIASSEAITVAHASFTTQYNTFLTLAEQLESKFQELEVREGAVKIIANEVGDKDQQLKERERECTEREQKVQVREREVETKEAKWNETEKRMQQNAAKLPNVIQINVGMFLFFVLYLFSTKYIGGQRFSISKEKLLQHKGSLFEQMIVSDHSQQLQATGEYVSLLSHLTTLIVLNRIFIERDPGYFKYIARFLRGTLQLPSTPVKCTEIEREFQFFKIPFTFPLFFERAMVYVNPLFLI